MIVSFFGFFSDFGRILIFSSFCVFCFVLFCFVLFCFVLFCFVFGVEKGRKEAS